MAVLVYGVLNAVLYAGLLPLWDGFDEPFHYGYVQYLSQHGALPVFGMTGLSAEVGLSLTLAPAGFLVKRNLPQAITFEEYFRLAEGQRIELRRRLERLSPQSGKAAPYGLNYEAQQAPLAYVVLAPFDALWAGRSLLARVFCLRLLCAVFSSLATGILLLKLAKPLCLPEVFRVAVLFLVFSSQVFYASTAHIGNEWLSIPLFLLFLDRCISYRRDPRSITVLTLAAVLAAGLLTKAYFLSVVPFALGLVAMSSLQRRAPWRHAAWFAIVAGTSSPWYLRNVLLYHNFTGMQLTAGGSPGWALVESALRLPWFRSVVDTLRADMWCGNNSATTFASKTVWLMLLLLATAGLLYLKQAVCGGMPPVERLLAAALFSYSAGLAYSAVAIFWSSKGAGITTAPWYVEVMAPPALCLLFAGMRRGGHSGRLLGIAMLWIWAYVMCATYAAKLIPLYGGYPTAKVHLADLLRWYARSFRQLYRALDVTAMLPAGAVLALATAVGLSAIFLAAWLSRAFIAE